MAPGKLGLDCDGFFVSTHVGMYWTEYSPGVHTKNSTGQ